jgi:hypothetical protein
MICDYIETHADELLAKYPSSSDDDKQVIYDASGDMIDDALSALGF